MIRPTFHSRYIVGATERHARDQRPSRNEPRLLDHIKIVQTNMDVCPLEPDFNEFSVVDMERREIALCEMPAGGATQAEAMIASYFAKLPMPVTDRIWAV